MACKLACQRSYNSGSGGNETPVNFALGRLKRVSGLFLLMDLSVLDQLDHPSFDYSWSPQKNESALSPEAAHSAWCSSPSSSLAWQDEFAKQESALLAGARAPAASTGGPSSVPAGPLAAVRSVSDSAANCAANREEGACVVRKGLSPDPTRKPAAPGAQMMDKRRCRLLHAPSFRPAIDAYRSQQLAAAAATAASEELSTEGRGARVAVFVRKRPMLPHEEARGDFDALSVAGGRLVAHVCLMKPDLRRMYMKHAAFGVSGAAFDANATSEQVYALAGAPLVAHALRGGRGALFMYGQTGSGKTHTMEAVHACLAEQVFGGGNDGAPRAAPHAAAGCVFPAAAAGDVLEVEVLAVEVLGRRCVDLSTRAECSLLQQPRGGLEIRAAGGLEPGRPCARSAAELQSLLRTLLAGRSTAATGSNATSSRSHALVQLRLRRTGGTAGRLTLLDCAGSEWSTDSAHHCPKRRAEGAEINASLHALKQCIRLHAERQRCGGKGHVPFRESVLTRLLAESFEAADARMAVLGCVAPAATDVEHSVGTMRAVLQIGNATGAEEMTTTPVPRLKRQ